MNKQYYTQIFYLILFIRISILHFNLQYTIENYATNGESICFVISNPPRQRCSRYRSLIPKDGIVTQPLQVCKIVYAPRGEIYS